MTTPSNGIRRALIVRGGWDGHVPVEATDLFRPFLAEQGFSVRVEESPAVYADPEAMAGLDLIVQCVTMSTITDEQLAGLRRAVETGTGLAGWHGGIADSYRNSSDYLQLIGGQFACHPAGPPDEPATNFLPHTIVPTALGATHPITTGIEEFELTTEQYWVLSDDLNDVLATTTLAARPWDPWSRPVTSAAVWTRQWGEGRVFVATPGHSLDVLADPSVRTIVERGMLWASR